MSSGSASTGGGDPGHESRAFVGAGNVGASPNFKAINVFGQATEHGYSSSSPSFKAKGGLIGATGSSK